MKIIAYRTASAPICERFKIAPASRERDWMTATPSRFAYRCLPLVIANQMGWSIACPFSFEAVWDGSPEPEGLRIRVEGDAEIDGRRWDEFIVPHFGSGILTFQLPYLFRTDGQYGLCVRGPTNTIKRGAVALDGYVETQWHDFTFTMNWKLTDPQLCVRFEQGESICMISPYNAAELADVVTEEMPVYSNPPLRAALVAKTESRAQFNADPNRGAGWQKDYFQGEDVHGQRQDGHLSKLKLGSFALKSE